MKKRPRLDWRGMSHGAFVGGHIGTPVLKWTVDGWIDDFAVFATALDAAQITTLAGGRPPSALIGDSDGDGMPDNLGNDERLKSRFRRRRRRPPDGDNISNLAEFKSGADSRDPNSGLRIASTGFEAGQFLMLVSVVVGKTYLLERCDDLNTRHWKIVNQFTATESSLQSVRDQSAAFGNRFYRIRLQAP